MIVVCGIGGACGTQGACYTIVTTQHLVTRWYGCSEYDDSMWSVGCAC